MLLCRVNRFTGVTFVGVPRPSSFNISVLEPDFPAFRTALDEIVALFKAFRRHSQSFRVQFCDIQLMLGDFKITHLLTREDSHVEAKSSHCRLIFDEETQTPLLQHSQTALSSSDRAVFTWRAQWDYLYTHITSTSGSQQALFVPRDKIPKYWWNVPLADGSVWLDWPADHPHSFDSFLVDEATDVRLVHDMERILMMNPTKAQVPIQMALVDSETLTEVSCQLEGNQSFFFEDKWDSSMY